MPRPIHILPFPTRQSCSISLYSMSVVAIMVRRISIATLVVGSHLYPCLGGCVMLGVHGWLEVDEEGEDIEGEDERDSPFENCSSIPGVSEIGYCKGCGCELERSSDNAD
jgi:hypothetical protein